MPGVGEIHSSIGFSFFRSIFYQRFFIFDHNLSLKWVSCCIYACKFSITDYDCISLTFRFDRSSSNANV